MRSLALIGIFAALTSCSYAEGGTAAERKVAHFHRAFNEQSFASLYEAAAPGFREQRPKEQFVAQMRAIHLRYGPVRSAQLKHRSSSPARAVGTFTTLTLETNFSNASATETFVFHDQRVPRLVSYSVGPAQQTHRMSGKAGR